MTTDAAPLPPIKVSWIFGLLAAFLIFVVIATYSSRMARDAGDYDQQRRTERLDILKKQRESDEKTLSTADWVDATKNTVRIPIDEAIPEEIITLKAKPVQMGAEIPGAKPMTPPAAPQTPNAIPAKAENEAPAGAPNAPSTNAAPSSAPAPAPAAPTK
jgi:hypothetical protein